MNKILKITLLVACLTVLSLQYETFVCEETWRSDGNYYDFSTYFYMIDYCMKVCQDDNSYQNVTNLNELSYGCCKPICDD